MKNHNRLPVILAVLILLILAALAGITIRLKWGADRALEKAERALDHLADTFADVETSPITIVDNGSEAGTGQDGTDASSGTAMSADGSSQPGVRLHAGEDLETANGSAANGLEAGLEPEGTSEAGRDADVTRTAKKTPDMSGYFTDEELATVAGSSHHVIFVGDSRTVGMGRAEEKIGDECVYIGESGEGYNWLIEYGIDLLDEAIRAHPNDPVIFNFGVNDCEAINAYIDVYHEIEAGYPNTKFYYMSVNPVTKESEHVPLSDVLAFNRRLKAAFPDQYIDTCSWMIRGGYEDVDGIHYSQEQYRKIHDYAVLGVTTEDVYNRGTVPV